MEIQQKLRSNQRRIGLTGGIASGKSTITNYIRTKKHISIIDADDISKELIKPNSIGYKKILNYFGNQIIDSSSLEKTISRKLLKKLIFENEKDRKFIEKLLHPLIKENMIEKCNYFNDKQTIVLVIPLLFEAKFEDICTEIWLVNCSKEVQLERLINRDKISKQEASKIINLQSNYEEKEKLANFILNNSDDHYRWMDEIEKLI